MSDVLERQPEAKPEADEHLVVDGRYVREQASEAVTLFLTPVSGIYRALFGPAKLKKGRRARKRAA